MLTLASDFWPWFWTILAIGVVVTIALSLLVAEVPLPRRHRPSATITQHPAAQARGRSHRLAA
jgi:predicted MFS family arabinose efflux permease